ncbi:MAG: hypothetical protein HY856_13905 [Burkholderiales bacterium]|nr:hypothetical protein [Burkholderiales bacterium]
MNSIQTNLYLKHSMSCLCDLLLEVGIDNDRREVVLAMAFFHSSLVADAVKRHQNPRGL